MSSISHKSAASSAYHYHSIFGDICSTRFRKLAQLIFTTSWLLSSLTYLFSSKGWLVVLFPLLRTCVLAFGLFLLACLRKNNLHVDFLGYKTLVNQVVGQIFNKKFVVTLVIYWVSSLIYFTSLHSQFTKLTLKAVARKHQYPPLNDQFVFYYFFAFWCSLVYALQHSIFDHDRLVFTYGNFHAHPKKAIVSKLSTILSNSIFFTICVITSAPLIYLFVRHYLYDAIFVVLGVFYSLNQNYPNLGLTFGFVFKLMISSFLLFITWELVNVAFNAYLSIGCLHRGHPLSELSTDPLGTLLTGLKSTKPFTKMTAFQELAFIAKTENSEGRMAIYNRNNRREFIWGEILQECEKVINQNNLNIIKALAQNTQKEATPKKTAYDDAHIFGREYYLNEGNYRNEDDLFVKPSKQKIHDGQHQSFLDANMIQSIMTNIKQMFKFLQNNYIRFVTSGFGIPFRYTTRREAERLCPIPVTVGNSVIAISLIATHAYDEDKKGSVSSTITEVLEILEKSVSTCGRFVQNPPAALIEKDEENLITILHELSMNAFFEVTVKYSDVLKEVVLTPEVYRLVNWTLETASNED